MAVHQTKLTSRIYFHCIQEDDLLDRFQATKDWKTVKLRHVKLRLLTNELSEKVTEVYKITKGNTEGRYSELFCYLWEYQKQAGIDFRWEEGV